jgi:hypothetical protein
LTAIAKLAVRFRQIAVVTSIFEQFAKHNHLEIQQRAGELRRVFEKAGFCEQILAPVEVDESLGKEREIQQQDVGLIEFGKKEEEGEGGVVPEGTAEKIQQQEAVGKREEPQQPQGSVEGLRTADYVVYFEIQRNVVNPRQLAIRSTVVGLGEIPLTQFKVQYGVPQGWRIMAQPPSGTVLEPIGGKGIQQVMVLENGGMNPLAMVAQISYMYRTQPITETGRINSIFN